LKYLASLFRTIREKGGDADTMSWLDSQCSASLRRKRFFCVKVQACD
jgi:hypothetical protein